MHSEGDAERLVEGGEGGGHKVISGGTGKRAT